MKRLVLLRHGETEWSATGKHTSRTDVALTPAGEEAARALGRRLEQLGVAPGRRVSSPRRRAVDTALLAGLGDGLETDERLTEVDYGEYEGLTTVEIRRHRPSWVLWRDGSPGGETMDEAGWRADDLLASLAPEEGDGDVVLVGHGHFLRLLTARYLDLSPPQARHLALGTASISVLGHEHEWRALLLWNDRAAAVAR
ncbi:MAG TPA: histidine phosphatase family protein [Acidimicrobiales bacterium]|nr:histidine phosphatase family protein [Acidimicrobiales bacterium]